MSISTIFLNAFGGMSVFLFFLIGTIFIVRKVGEQHFNYLSTLLMVNLAVFQLTVLIELNNNDIISPKGMIIILFVRYASLMLLGPIILISTALGLHQKKLLTSGISLRLLVGSIVLFIILSFIEFYSNQPFAFISDKYFSFSNYNNFTIKRILILSHLLIYNLYSFFVYIKPLKTIKNYSDKGMIEIFFIRYKVLLLVLIVQATFCFSSFSEYWISIFLFVHAATAFIQFLLNTIKYSTLTVRDLYPSEESIQKKNKIIDNNGKNVQEKIEKVMTEERLYLDSNLSLKTLSSYMKMPSHIVSIVINEQLGKSFIQLVNNYRIEDAKKLLLKNDETLSISTIAFDVGFNSVSTFNRAFKNYQGITPSEFQKGNC